MKRALIPRFNRSLSAGGEGWGEVDSLSAMGERAGVRWPCLCNAHSTCRRTMTDGAGKCEYHYVLIDFYCAIQSGELRAGDDSRRVDWFDIESLSGIAVTDGTREVIETCCARPVTHSHVTRP